MADERILHTTQMADERIQAIANLEYLEKIAVLEDYIYRIENGQPVSVKSLYYDIRALQHIERFANPGIRQELNRKLYGLVKYMLQKQPFVNLLICMNELLNG
jgi:hypothetical protein